MRAAGRWVRHQRDAPRPGLRMRAGLHATGWRVRDAGAANDAASRCATARALGAPSAAASRAKTGGAGARAQVCSGAVDRRLQIGGGTDKAIARYDSMQRSGGLVTKEGVRSTSVKIERRDDTHLKITLDPRTRAGKKLSADDELKALQEYASQLSQDLEVEYAHPNWIMTLQRDLIRKPVYLESLPKLPPMARPAGAGSGPNDSAFRDGLHWHYLPPPEGMNAIGAWNKTTGGRDIVVAVLDTGILPRHPDIKDSGNLLPGYDFISDPKVKGDGLSGWDADPTDVGDQCPLLGNLSPTWHGTHVAGTVGAAATNNNLGIAGVNWAVSVLPVRVLGRCGGSIDDISTGIQWSAGLEVKGVPRNARKADIINMSLGIDIPCSPANVGVLIRALSQARQAGVTVVVAAGNAGRDIKDYAPSGCSGVVSVAASDRRGHLAGYSNFGTVTIMAPGGDLGTNDEHGRPNGVYSLLAPSAENPSGVAGKEGTSMAAPHVAAAIALTLGLNPGLRGRPEEIERLLTRTAAPLPTGACAVPCGAGLLDAEKMLEPGALSTGSGR